MLPAAAAATQTVLQDSRKVAALAGFLPGLPVLRLAKNLDRCQSQGAGWDEETPGSEPTGE